MSTILRISCRRTFLVLTMAGLVMRMYGGTLLVAVDEKIPKPKEIQILGFSTTDDWQLHLPYSFGPTRMQKSLGAAIDQELLRRGINITQMLRESYMRQAGKFPQWDIVSNGHQQATAQLAVDWYALECNHYDSTVWFGMIGQAISNKEPHVRPTLRVSCNLVALDGKRISHQTGKADIHNPEYEYTRLRDYFGETPLLKSHFQKAVDYAVLHMVSRQAGVAMPGAKSRNTAVPGSGNPSTARSKMRTK